MGAWLELKGHRFGATVSPQVVYELGADWYATRLEANWQPAPVSAAQAILTKHDLTGEFWTLAG